MKTALIVLSVAAVVLGVFTYFIVFYPSGSYQPVIIKGPGGTSTSTIATSTLSTSSISSSSGTGNFASGYSSPYPLVWAEGSASLTITAASLQGNNLTLNVTIRPSDGSRCVTPTLRWVADESGALKPPDSQSCDNGSGPTYTESLTFMVDPTLAPLLFTTRGT